MKILFVHQGFPGQYCHILDQLARQGGHTLVGLGIEKPSRQLPKGVSYVRYRLPRGNTPGVHPWAMETETKMIRGEACAAAAHELKEKGFMPDLICAHPGWGESLFLKEIWPETPLLCYQEFFYQVEGFDLNFDHEFQRSLEWRARARTRAKNPFLFMTLQAANWNVSATAFQRSSFPLHWQERISVIHDGIDTQQAAPDPDATPLSLSEALTLHPGEGIVTFVNRRFEPYRGCHIFLRSLPELQRRCPDARIVIVGETKGVSYGAPCPDGEWKDRFLAEIEGRYDPTRVHFVGRLSHGKFLHLLQLSACHVYLTYPFVLSWSLLEAMCCGCAVVGSATAPVQEVISDGKNGLLVDFFQPDDLAGAVAALLADRSLARALGDQARKTILETFDLRKCLPRQLALMDLVASGALGS